MRGAGKTFIAIGVLLLLFVAYELWGTNLAEARSQRGLRHQFLNSLTTTSTTEPSPVVSAPPPTSTTIPVPVPTGEAVAIIDIPKIGVEKAVVEGVGVEDLKKGPGHYPGTPMPGQPGNVAIAGHRTTYGAPFNRIDELTAGDPIVVTTRQGQFRYEVFAQNVVSPDDVAVLNSTGDNRLTLTTCNPKYSAAQRLVVSARLVVPPAPPPPTTTVPPSGVAQAQIPRAGLSGEQTSRFPAFAWGALAFVVAFGIWLWGRAWRRWAAYLIGTPAFLLVLFIFFENVSRLLPANI